MSVTVKQLCLVFVVTVIIRCSQSFSISVIPDGEAESPREPRFAAPRGRRGNTPFDEIREPRFAAPRGKRLLDEESAQKDSFIFRAPRLGKRLVVMDDPTLKQLGTDETGNELGDRYLYRIGRNAENEKKLAESKVQDDERSNPIKRETRSTRGESSFLRIGRAQSDTASFLRIGRSPHDSASFLRIGRAPSDSSSFLRIGRAPSDPSSFLRIGRAPSDSSSFLRIGRAPSDSSSFLRIGRDVPDKTSYLRIGRSSGQPSSFLRIGRAPEETSSFLRIGRGPVFSALVENKEEDTDANTKAVLQRHGRGNVFHFDDKDLPANFTPEELELILQNRERLLALLQENPAPTAPSNTDDGYFAFPRQGRAMSFYFPRMGRSGDDSNTNSCCEGLRTVFTMHKGSFDICQPMQDCCPGLEQRTKIVKDYVLTECAPSEKLENIRELINEDSLQ